jgi:hypothetical protein
VRRLYPKAVKRAAEIYGEQALADRLGVGLPVLRLWISGAAALPDRIFLEVTEILSEHGLQNLKRNHEQHPNPKGES